MIQIERKPLIILGMGALCREWFTRLEVTQVTLKQTGDVVSATGSLIRSDDGIYEGKPVRYWRS